MSTTSLLLTALAALASLPLLLGLAAQKSSQEKSPRIYRVIVQVGDLERAAAFYTELLGVEGVRVSEGRHYFDCGGVILALYSPRGDGDDFDPRPLPDHIYFAVDDLDAVFRRVEKLGGLATESGDGDLPMGRIAERPWGERSFYMADPFGNRLCFVDRKTLFTGQ